ncbi:hypothetical protein TrVFT333_011650 [Trichoderma virens FT-333]|nr:hypothetical protein TrVFT333_011650 [Trichoderma virens FT-333]
MKFQTLASVLAPTLAVFSHSAKAQVTACAGSVGDWFAMAVYPSIHNATYDSTFDMDYYNQTQFPWVYSLYKPYGMKGYTITQLDSGAPYSVVTLMYFDNADQYHAALAAHLDEIWARVPLFSSEYPISYPGHITSTIG